MKTIKAIYLDNFKLDFHKTRKEYLIYLKTKSIPKMSSFTKMPKIGVICGSLDKATQTITLTKRVPKTSQNKDGFKELKSFTPTAIDFDRTSHNRIYYKTQEYLHKDIILSKKSCEVYFEDGFTKCTGQELADYLWESKDLPNFTPNKVKVKSYLNIPDDKLSGEEIRLKMEEEISIGLVPF